MASSSSESVSPNCSRNRKCSKPRNHRGKCDSKGRSVGFRFWENSQFFHLKRKQGDFNKRKQDLEERECASDQLEEGIVEKTEKLQDLSNQENEAEIRLKGLESKQTDVAKSVAEQERHLEELNSQFQKLKHLLSQTDQSRRRRENCATTLNTITCGNSSLRYRRRDETESILSYIHGGKDGAVFGAWDFVAANTTKENMDKLIGSYKRGRYLQKLVSDAVSDYNKSEDSLKQALALKFSNYLSRRKFNVICKTQTSVFDADKEIWVPRNMKCAGVDMRVPLRHISSESIDKFIKTLDIGHVNQIPGFSGVTRTITGLVFMILDLHLRMPYLYRKLIWFNDNTNHFIFQFSDDGAPETSQLSMSIGSITIWNLGERVRSRDHQYLLHCVSLPEKHDVLALIWQQHTDEMRLLESSVFTVCGKECTLQFEPAADMSWQSWACNELNQAATYPSPYANVSKANMTTMGGTIGIGSEHLWNPYTTEIREKHLKLLKKFVSGLSTKIEEETRHKKMLEYMALNGIRQLGPPRVGSYADQMRPDPLHCEINAWQNLLDLIYGEAVKRNLFSEFLEKLSAPTKCKEPIIPTEQEISACTSNREESVSDSTLDLSPSALKVSSLRIADDSKERYLDILDKSYNFLPSTGSTPGCNLASLSAKINDHYNDVSRRQNKLPTRLIGEQAITLARYSFRLIDALKTEDESPQEKVKRLAISKIAEYLRNAGGLFNKINTTQSEVTQLKEFCELYFNLYALFFSSNINVSVWTMGYAIPYHAQRLYDLFKVGYGIISLQAKESKHAGLKEELNLTNRSKDNSEVGKWWQVMRSNYVRTFYLPEHQPLPPTYISHYKPRIPPHCKNETSCDCGREKQIEDINCCVCTDSTMVVECAQNKSLSTEIVGILKPAVCELCNSRFADNFMLEKHKESHNKGAQQSGELIPKSMSVENLKKELKARGFSVSGKKDILVQRLEGILSNENS